MRPVPPSELVETVGQPHASADSAAELQAVQSTMPGVRLALVAQMVAPMLRGRFAARGRGLLGWAVDGAPRGMSHLPTSPTRDHM